MDTKTIFAGVWRPLGLAALVSAVVMAPVIAPYASLRNQDGFRSTLNLEEADQYSADHRAVLRGHSRVVAMLLPRSRAHRLAPFPR